MTCLRIYHQESTFWKLTRGSVVAAEKPLEASPEQSSHGTSSPSSGHVALRFVLLLEFFRQRQQKGLKQKGLEPKTTSF